MKPRPNAIDLRKSFIISFIFIIIFSSTQIVSAKINTRVSQDTSSVAEPILPIAVSNIGSETDNTLNKLREYRNRIKIAESEITIDSLIPIYIVKIKEWRESIDLDEFESMQARQIEAINDKLDKLS